MNNAVAAGLPEGLPKIWNPAKFYLMIEHTQPPNNLKTALRGKKLRELAERYRIQNFYDMTCGICHQIMVNKAHALPGHLIIGCELPHDHVWCIELREHRDRRDGTRLCRDLWRIVVARTQILSHYADGRKARLADGQGHHAPAGGRLRR